MTRSEAPIADEVNRPWQPLPVEQVAGLFQEVSFPWWVAGGHAIELAVGHPIRDHADVDILILRRDHGAARALLAAWDCHAADPPGSLRPWPIGETLPDTVHDIWCGATANHPWQFQLMIDESDGDRWRSRRDSQIALPMDAIGARTDAGVPYLRPGIQLMYKARSRRPKDELDLAEALPILDPSEGDWLRDTIVLAYGPDHPWLPQLAVP